MSLRFRLFILIGGLVALLVVAQWWWARVLVRDMSSEIDEVASSVGHSVATFFHDFDRHAVSGAPQTKVIECFGEDCEDVTIRQDTDVAHALTSATGAHPKTEQGEGDAPEKMVIIKKFQLDEDAKLPGDVVTYTYSHQTTGESGTEPGAENRVESHVKLHIEHQGDARYLRLAGPSIDRRFQIPERGFSDKLERFSRRLIFGSVGFLTLGLVLAGVVAHRVTTPLRQLSVAARRVGEGALGTRVPLEAGGEVGQALAAFNRMSGRLEELDRRNRELSARKHLGEIGEISRGLAHTLRNPLNALGLSVEELAAGDASAGPELAESARRQIRRIDSSLKSFLALASQSGGVLAKVDLGELVEDVALEALQDSRGKARLDLAPVAELPRLSAVEPELRAVLQALIVNAIEASPEHGQVTARATAPEAGRWRLEIEDEGPGLPEAVRSRLFTPHLSTKANGSGMGLFLAHRIATNRYHGSLELVDLQDDTGEVRGTRASLEIGERTGAGGPGEFGESTESEEVRGDV